MTDQRTIQNTMRDTIQGTAQPSINIHLAATQPSATYKVLDKIAEKKRQGHPVISLCAGEPDFDTPEHVADAAIAAIKSGKTRYTPVAGLPELRQAVAKKFETENQIKRHWQQTLVSSGGKQIIFNALAATLNIDDEVLIPAPFWVSYPEIVSLCGATAKIIACTSDTQFKLRPDTLTHAITEKTRWLIVNSPSNPTGAVYSKTEWCELAEVLRAYPDILILCDDIYEHLVYSKDGFYTLAQVAPDLQHRIVTMNGASKGFAMTGWRIGYCTGPQWLIDAMIKLQGQQTSGACSISQHAALAALTGTQEFLHNNLDNYQSRRDLLVNKINNIEGLQCDTPDGAFYVFVNCEKWIGKCSPKGKKLDSDNAIVDALLDEANVGIMHGSAFGLGPYLRISFATSEQQLELACQALQAFAVLCKESSPLEPIIEE